jgi:hypothetical protein
MLLPNVSRGAALVLLTVSTAAAQAPKRASSPAEAVEEFMHAVADSNLTRMAQLFGTRKGSAYKTHQPPKYEERMLTIQLFLHGVQAHALGDLPTAHGGRTVTTQLSHGTCHVTIPVLTANSRSGWLVESFDLAQAAQINRPCENGNGGP